MQMLRKEWSLIVNSLLVQLAAGMFIFTAVFRMVLADPAEREAVFRLTAPGMVITGPILAIGMFSSFFHLGNPFRAFRAVANMGSSWLSREILFTSIFFMLWAVCFFLEIHEMSCQTVTWLTVLSAILSVTSMAGIYYSTGKPGWHSITTYTGFMGSIIILGSMGTATLFLTAGEISQSVNALANISIFLLLGVLALKLFQQLILISQLNLNNDIIWNIDKLVAGSVPRKDLAALHKTLTLWGLLLSIAGAVPALFIVNSVNHETAGRCIIASAVFVLAGEFLGRAGFYGLGLEDEGKKIRRIPGRDVYGRYINR
jgi:anaerobic dimethyl sulfoxide reductase subunit C (anchor subunit)